MCGEELEAPGFPVSSVPGALCPAESERVWMRLVLVGNKETALLNQSTSLIFSFK